MRSGRTEVLDPPGSAEEFPRWLTLREASFVTGLDEDALRAWVASGKVGCDRSLSRKLGEGYLLLRSKDLQDVGLLRGEASAVAGAPAVAATPTVDPQMSEPEVDLPEATAQRPAPRGLRVALPSLGGSGRIALRWVGNGLLAGLVVASFLPLLHGYRTFAVTSGRMAPAIRSGDLVLDRAIRTTAVRPGDVVTFVDPNTGRSVTTRIRSAEPSDGQVRFEGRGDADQVVLRWSIPADGHVDLVVGKVWGIGAPLSALPGHVDRRLSLIFPAFALTVALLAWRRQHRATSPPRPSPSEARGF